MSIQDLGSIGELIAAIATVLTLIYLAFQLRQNTRAMRSSTFQQISAEMSQNVESFTTNPDLAAILVKAISGGSTFTPVEQLQFQGFLVMTFRRLEAVYVQHKLGSIEKDLVEGFERSLLPNLVLPNGSEWWATAKHTFHRAFVAHIDQRLENGDILDRPPSLQISKDTK